MIRLALIFACLAGFAHAQGPVEAAISAVEGIERAKSHGKDIQLDALGRVRLQRPLKRSELNVMVRAKILDAYKERSDKVATMLELASSGLKAAQTADAVSPAAASPAAWRSRPSM